MSERDVTDATTTDAPTPDAPYIAEWYQGFADAPTPNQSDLYRSWARGVAADADLLALLSELPRSKRQPHLIFAVSRLLGAPEASFERWREWVLENWTQLRAEALVRGTQTNEPGRAAAFLPLLAQIAATDGPIALLEVGASAGLCLYPDRYSYEYAPAAVTSRSPDRRAPDLRAEVRRLDPPAGPSDVLLRCEVSGPVPLPTAMPQIVWRAGIDLQPLDVSDDADLRWLQMLVGPEQQERRDRIAAAAAIARQDPPLLVKGDVTAALSALAATAPPEATLVVLVVGVLVYLGPDQRAEFATALTELGSRWISLENPSVFPSMAAALARNPAPGPGLFPLALDGVPVAWCSPHGQSIAWI